VTQRESYIDIHTTRHDSCDWGAWNQFLIFLLLEEKGGFDHIRVIGPHKTIVKFLDAEGYRTHIFSVRMLPA
jgi:hypothetical protein